MKIKKIKLLCLLALPVTAIAGGFQVNTQSVKGTAMGGAYSGICRDASGVFFNPGSMGFMEKNSVTLGSAFVFPNASYLNPFGGNVDMEKQTFVVPQLYGNYKINEKISVGLSVNAPYGLGTKWDATWTGRYVSESVKLTSIYIQPTASYMITNDIGVGAGFVIATGHANVQKAAQAGNNDVQSELDGGGVGYGYNIGVFAKIGEKARVGVDYHSKVKVDLKDGDATFTNVPSYLLAAGQLPASTTFNSGITLPGMLSIGASYQFTEKIMGTLQFDFTGWDVYDSLNFEFPDYAQLNSNNGRNYKNSAAYRLGVEYKATSKISACIGFAIDQTPVQDGYVSPDLPDADKMLYTVGASYQINEKFSADLSYMYENLDERNGTYTQANFSGKYKTRVSILAVGINYAW
jgi:long-chain fatty acid transport protein